MYCAKCGTQINLNLNYCNACGAKTLNNVETEDKVSPLNALITSLSFVVLGGFGILVGMIALLLNKGMTHEAIAILAIAYLVTLFGICFSLTRLTSKLIDARIKEKAESSNQFVQPVQLPAPNTAQLEESFQQPASVTEHTTRSFNQAFVDKRD